MKFHKTNDKQASNYNRRQKLCQSQVSSAKYSDISSQYLHRAKQLSDIELDITSPLNRNSQTHLAKKQKKQLHNPSISIERENIELDSQQFIQMFGDQDSILSLDKIFPENEFRQNAKQLGIQPSQRQSIVYKFYKQKRNSSSNGDHYSNKYYVDYLKWKQQENDNSMYTLKKNINEFKTNSQAVKDILMRKQMQKQAYKIQLIEQNRKKSLQQLQKNLKQISQQYQSKLKKVMDLRCESQINLNQKYEQNKKERNLQKIKSLGFQKIQYPIIQAVQCVQYNTIAKKQEIDKVKTRPHKSFVDIIKRPPPQKVKQDIQIDIELDNEAISKKIINQSKINQNILGQQSKLNWKLDIQQMLKIPYKEFLLFFNQYENKLIALSSPQQLKKLRKYRKQALYRQQALNKLKQKIAMQGQDIFKKLSSDKKKKLFELLYQQQVEQQKKRGK